MSRGRVNLRGSSSNTEFMERGLEIQRDFRSHGARSYIMRAAAGGKEVIHGGLVGRFDGGQVKGPFVMHIAEDVVLADGGVEEVARRNALRVLIVVACTGRGDAEQTGRVL